jgi:hypothetical protein
MNKKIYAFGLVEGIAAGIILCSILRTYFVELSILALSIEAVASHMRRKMLNERKLNKKTDITEQT